MPSLTALSSFPSLDALMYKVFILDITKHIRVSNILWVRPELDGSPFFSM